MITDTLFEFNIADILKDSNYSLTQFEEREIEAFNNSIVIREIKGKPFPYVKCIVRQKEIKLTPEEIVRQLFVRMLIQRYQYPVKRMSLEVPVNFGREIKRADIVVFDKDRPNVPYIMVEIKKPKLKDGKEQLRSYCNATGSPMGVWSNGGSISYYHRKDPNYFEDITDIPTAHQSISDVLNERFTIDDLIAKDKLINEKKSLKDLILEMEDEVLANAGVDVLRKFLNSFLQNYLMK